MVNFLTAFGAVLLTFLAGAEIDPDSLRVHLKAPLAIGFVSFLAPFSPWPEKGREYPLSAGAEHRDVRLQPTRLAATGRRGRDVPSPSDMGFSALAAWR